MTVVLRTNTSQVLLMVFGVGLVGWWSAAIAPTFGLLGFLLVVWYTGATYPLRSVVTPSTVTVRALLRTRVIEWDDVLAVRRTRGPLRRSVVEGRRHYRLNPGAVMVVLEGGKSILLVGQTETAEVNRALVAVVAQASPALADSLRLPFDHGQ